MPLGIYRLLYSIVQKYRLDTLSCFGFFIHTLSLDTLKGSIDTAAHGFRVASIRIPSNNATAVLSWVSP